MSQFPYTIDGAPDYAMVNIEIPANQTLRAEASSLAAMSAHITMKTRFKGGFKRLLTKESLFINEFTSKDRPGTISLSPGPSGDIAHHSIDAKGSIYLTASAFVASTLDVVLDSHYQGLVKGFFARSSMFLVKCSGKGDIWFHTIGGLLEVDVEDEYVVDTGHVVAFTDGLNYAVEKVGGYKSFFFSGEGLVCRFKGQGTLWIQTRNPLGLMAWADQFRMITHSSSNGE